MSAPTPLPPGWYPDPSGKAGKLLLADVTHDRLTHPPPQDRDRYSDFTHPVKRPKNEHAGHVARIMKWINEYGDQALEVEAIPSPELYLPHPWITEAGRNTIRPNTWDNLGVDGGREPLEMHWHSD